MGLYTRFQRLVLTHKNILLTCIAIRGFNLKSRLLHQSYLSVKFQRHLNEIRGGNLDFLQLHRKHNYGALLSNFMFKTLQTTYQNS